MVEFFSGQGDTTKQLFYMPAVDRLMFRYHAATASHWEDHWDRFPRSVPANSFAWECKVTARFLAKGSRMLEGGCGLGTKVASLHAAGYRATGLDFAKRAVEQARRDYPGVDIREGDVRATGLGSESMDGYWSLGVVEHFPEGPQEILQEAARVLKPGGYLFLTAPWFSPYRRSLVRLGRIPNWEPSPLPGDFYQYAFDRSEIEHLTSCAGLDVVHWRPLNGAKGWNDDSPTGHRVMRCVRKLPRPVRRPLNKAADVLLRGRSGHSFLAVCRKRS